MGLESVTYISDLDTANPVGTDLKSLGDNHIRNLKTGIKNTFPNITGAMTLTHTQLNKAAYFDSGTKMMFLQAAAPAGWTQDNTVNDKVLRIIDNTGTGAATGGNWTLSGMSVDGHAITISEMPAHTHSEVGCTITSGSTGSFGGGYTPPTSTTTGSTGGGATHTHGLTNSTWRPAYVDAIVCVKS